MSEINLSGIELIRAFAKEAPAGPGVYRMLDASSAILYIGKAKNLRKRILSYAQLQRLPSRLQRMVLSTAHMEITTARSEAEALLLEASLIKHHRPRYNIDLKDDKTFPYIALSKHPFPRIYKFRGKRQKDEQYFGPYASAGDVNRAIRILQKIFLLRPCADTVFRGRTRPCIEYQIKRCSAPCVRNINEADYATLVQEVKDFFTGKSRAVQERLRQQMLEASAALDYELATQLRDRIRALATLQASQSVHVSSVADADVIALVREGSDVCIYVLFLRYGNIQGSRSFFPKQAEDVPNAEVMEQFIARFYQTNEPTKCIMVNIPIAGKTIIEEALHKLHGVAVRLLHPQRGDKLRLISLACDNAKQAIQQRRSASLANTQLLEGLAELFGLPATPQRIEVYDNSHISGTHAVGAMIVAGPEGFMKNHYRKFNIKQHLERPGINAGDDYAMMQEVFTRRFKRLQQENTEAQDWPDLVLIDGGKGQLSVAMQVFKTLGIESTALVAIAKGPQRNAGRETFFQPGKEPFQLPSDDPRLHYLQRLRDEVHRFAISSHRNKRSRAIVYSSLDRLQGVGGARKKALLQFFGSAKAVERASAEDIARVPGISAKLALTIYAQLHEY